MPPAPGEPSHGTIAGARALPLPAFTGPIVVEHVRIDSNEQLQNHFASEAALGHPVNEQQKEAQRKLLQLSGQVSTTKHVRQRAPGDVVPSAEPKRYAGPRVIETHHTLRSEADVRAWVASMADAGFPQAPNELPRLLALMKLQGPLNVTSKRRAA